MIKAEALTMHYGPVVALEGASFEVNPGEVVGLLGPNGAGKSTTMKILTTYLHPTPGTAQVAGHDILDEPVEVRRKMDLEFDLEGDRLHLKQAGQGKRGKGKKAAKASWPRTPQNKSDKIDEVF